MLARTMISGGCDLTKRLRKTSSTFRKNSDFWRLRPRRDDELLKARSSKEAAEPSGPGRNSSEQGRNQRNDLEAGSSIEGQECTKVGAGHAHGSRDGCFGRLGHERHEHVHGQQVQGSWNSTLAVKTSSRLARRNAWVRSLAAVLNNRGSFFKRKRFFQ